MNWYYIVLLVLLAEFVICGGLLFLMRSNSVNDQHDEILQQEYNKRLELLKMDYPVTLPDDTPTTDFESMKYKKKKS